MIKTVNVMPVIPVMALRTPIMGAVVNCKMSDGDILQCIYSRALVDEVLEDGTLVRLNLTNYNKDNSHLMKNIVKEVKVEEPVIEPIKEEIIIVEQPVVEEVKMVEEPVKEEVVEPVVETPQVEEPVVEEVVEEVKVEEPVQQQRDRKNNNKKNKR